MRGFNSNLELLGHIFIKMSFLLGLLAWLYSFYHVTAGKAATGQTYIRTFMSVHKYVLTQTYYQMLTVEWGRGKVGKSGMIG